MIHVFRLLSFEMNNDSSEWFSVFQWPWDPWSYSKDFSESVIDIKLMQTFAKMNDFRFLWFVEDVKLAQYFVAFK